MKFLKGDTYSIRCSTWEFLVEPFLFGRKSNTFHSFVVTFRYFFPLKQKVFKFPELKTET